MCRGCGDKNKKKPLESIFAGAPPSGVEGEAPQTSPILDDRQAAWLEDRLNAFATLVAYVSALKRSSQADDHEMYDSAVTGAVRGQARAITRIFGYRPGESLEPYTDYGRIERAHI